MIRHWEDQEDQGEGSSKRIWLTLDRELSLVLKELEISFSTEPMPSMEEIWSEVDQALNLNDGMGLLDVGGYDIRYLFLPTTKPCVDFSTVPYFNGRSKELAVISFSTPDNALLTCQHKKCACSDIIDEVSIEDVYTVWLLDSGASMHFTPNHSDFTSYEEVTNEHVTTALGLEMIINGKGSVFIKHNFRSQILFEENDDTQTVRISPVYHVEGLHGCLFSLGTFLKNSFTCIGSAQEIKLHNIQGKDFMHFTLITIKETCYHISVIV